MESSRFPHIKEVSLQPMVRTANIEGAGLIAIKTAEVALVVEGEIVSVVAINQN